MFEKDRKSVVNEAKKNLWRSFVCQLVTLVCLIPVQRDQSFSPNHKCLKVNVSSPGICQLIIFKAELNLVYTSVTMACFSSTLMKSQMNEIRHFLINLTPKYQYSPLISAKHSSNEGTAGKTNHNFIPA